MGSFAPIFAEIGISQMIFCAGLALLAVVLLVRSRRHFRQVSDYQVPRADAPLPSQSGKQSTGPYSGHATLSRDFEKWEVAMHDLARDLSGQLDSKIRILEILIRDAEKVSARLETALARGRGIIDSAREPQPPTNEKRDEQPVASVITGPSIKRQVISPPPLADKPRFDRIYALADAGLSPARIASQVGSQVGEVELILGIRGETSASSVRLNSPSKPVERERGARDE